LPVKPSKVIGDETNAKVIAGGLIKEQDEVKQAINSGAKYITSSDRSIMVKISDR
jgi:glycerol uptake operon antiterminator